MSNTKSIPVSFRLTESEHAAIVRISGDDAAKSLSETIRALALEGLAERLAKAKTPELSVQIDELKSFILTSHIYHMAALMQEIEAGRRGCKDSPEEHFKRNLQRVKEYMNSFCHFKA